MRALWMLPIAACGGSQMSAQAADPGVVAVVPVDAYWPDADMSKLVLDTEHDPDWMKIQSGRLDAGVDAEIVVAPSRINDDRVVTIERPDLPNAEFFCSDSATEPDNGFCVNAREFCEEMRETLSSSVPDLDACRGASVAFCFRSILPNGNNIGLCSPNAKACEARRKEGLASRNRRSIAKCERKTVYERDVYRP